LRLGGGPIRDVIDNLLDRLGDISLRYGRRSLVVLRKVVHDLRGRLGEIRLRSAGRPQAVLRTAADSMRVRSRDVRWGLVAGRLRRSPDAIIVVPLLGAALILGVLAATAATRKVDTGSDNVRAAFRQVTSGPGSTEVVTQTIRRNGKTVRVIRYKKKPGRVILETTSGPVVTLPGHSVTLPGRSVTLPAVTVTNTRTKTVTEVVTTTEIQPPVTVTEISTVTETEPSPHP
jgi:hypothetical protein